MPGSLTTTSGWAVRQWAWKASTDIPALRLKNETALTMPEIIPRAVLHQDFLPLEFDGSPNFRNAGAGLALRHLTPTEAVGDLAGPHRLAHGACPIHLPQACIRQRRHRRGLRPARCGPAPEPGVNRSREAPRGAAPTRHHQGSQGARLGA